MAFKRALSFLLSAAVITAALPGSVLAEEPLETEVEAAVGTEADEDEPVLEDEEEAEPDGEDELEDKPGAEPGDEADDELEDEPEAENETEDVLEDEAGSEETVYTLESSDRGKVSVTARTYPCYLFYFDSVRDLPVYFADNAPDIPYINLEDWKDIMVALYNDVLEIGGYDLEMETDGHTVLFTRENDYTALFDFIEGTIDFEDFDAFFHAPGDTSLLDTVTTNLTNEDGVPTLLKRLEKGSFDRYGKEVVLNLSDYDIPVYWSEEENLYLLPLQTLGDFFTSLNLELNPFFNEKAVYLVKQDMLFAYGMLTELGLAVYGTEEEREENKESRREKWPGVIGESPNGPISEELVWFNYQELCLVLDNLYGLKEQHGIEKFDDVFTETGYRSKLLDLDPGKVDGALMDFIHFYLDDQHSSFKRQSYLTDGIDSYENLGLSARLNSRDEGRYRDARAAADHEIQCYEEVGNTAYITFDLFSMGHLADEYYTTEAEVPSTPDERPVDTVALILYAHEQITREDSPIENVVIDLSLNDGGQIDAGAVVAAWFLGEAQFDVMSSLTGALSTGIYQLDANLDSSYDEEDTLSDRNLFCLISPVSFSCGNLLPSVFKASHRVNLIGKTSGGGSCMVLPMSTAIGTCIRISSPINLAYVKNGSYYVIDSGVDPDYTIAKPENFYDREALTDYINNLF